MDDAIAMPPQDASPSPPPQTPAIQDSVVEADLHTDNVVHHSHTAPTSPSAGDTTNRIAWVSTGLVVGAILLAIFGAMSDAWAVQEESQEVLGTPMSFEIEMGLDDITSTICIDGECNTTKDDLSSAYDNCTSNANELEFNASQTEEMCGDLGKTASAGFTGMILISIGILVMLITLVAPFMGSRSTMMPYSQYYPFGGGGFILLGVVAWYMMLPEDDISLGYGAWMTIVSIVLAAAAGGYAIYNRGSVQSSGIISRIPGQGVRALTAESEAREFVLRENAMGTKSTSLVEQGKVLRLVYAKLDNEDVVTEDHFIVQKAALTGFTHYRYDWLDNGKYMWWLMTAVGIISLFISPAIGSSLLLIGALFSLAQLFDPELLSFETNAGRHRLLLYRQDSNRELTNYSMDKIDVSMQQLLSGEQLDGSSVEAKAAEIEENRAAEIKAKQEAATAVELAKVTAAAAPVISPTTQPPPISTPEIEPAQQPVAEAEAEPIVVEPEVVIPPPSTPKEVSTSVQSLPPPPTSQTQSLPPPLPLPPQAQSLPPAPLPLHVQPLPPPPLSLLDEPLPPPPLSLLDEPLPPPPPPTWGD